MMEIRPFACLVALSFFFAEPVTTAEKRLIFGQCEVNGVSLRELRNYFSAIRHEVQTQDNRTDVILLNKRVLLHTSKSESCDLLRHLLRFYMKRVFKHYNTTDISSLANAFLSIKHTLKQCHDQNKCTGGEESRKSYQLVLDEYDKLDNKVGVNKALGEMDLLFAWMESN